MVSKTTMNIVIGVTLLCLGSILTLGFLLSLPGGNNLASASSAVQADSSIPSIFNYCTWQPEFTTQIGKYNTAPDGQKYAVVTLNINNTGNQTYSTNPNYWHLKIDDVYYQYDSATYDDSLHHLTADIGPGGKITVKIAYLVDKNLSINEIDMYYNGPGADGTIGSNEGVKPVDSSTPSIFNYCTWQPEFTTQIGKYNTAPDGQKYAVVTLKINNTGNQTYSTNPNYWHLKIDDVYYQYDSATFDNSLHHLTADIGPGGKITVKIAYLVDRNLSINDIDMYYNGPGADGTIGSNEGVKPVDSSTPNIFNYCILQGEFTTQIGKYHTAPDGQKYAVVTLSINNTGDQTYSTNPNYWHLKIGDIYYQYDSATFDNSLHHLTAYIGPGGKITVKIAYLVDRNLSINDMYIYYDGPGSDGTIIDSTSPVKPLLLIADFTVNTTSGYAPLVVQFKDASQNAISRSWDFGDGNNSTEKSPTHIYSTAGNYTTNLTVSNINGTASKSATIIVLEYKVLPIADFNVNTTSGYAPLSVQFTDLSQNATSRNWDIGSDGTIESTNVSFAYMFSVPGNYPVNLTAINENGTSSKPATIVVSQQSSSGGGSSGGSHKSGGGGGGGGGGSPEPARNVQVKEISQTYVASGKPVKIDFTKNATCVVYVSFDSKKTAGKVTTIAEQLKAKSTLVSNMNTGEVYKYFNLWVGNAGFATEKNIENPVVCFKVEKSWMQDKKIDQNSITLNRYIDKKWEQSPVNLSGEDNKYLYFTAKTSGFSSFAITGTAKSSYEETVTEAQIDYPETINNNTENRELQTQQKEIPSTPSFGICYGIFSLFAVLLYKRK